MLRTGNLLIIILITVSCLLLTLSLTARTTASDPQKSTPPVKQQLVVKKAIPKNRELSDVIDRLIRDGFEKQRIETLFGSKDVYFTTKGVSTFFSYFESAPNYHQFLEKDSIDKAAQYAAKYKETLDKAEDVFGVDKTVITAILLVETRLGTYVGKHSTINMLASIAALDNETLKTRVWNNIPSKAKPKKDKFLKKVKKRVPWSYNELKAFLTFTQRENIQPETIKGSFAGAIGFCQFMPSNALKIARDGNGDGKIDLFTHEDAIFSIANYLKVHGWKTGLSRQQQYDVIYSYNHSNYYVDTIQKVSDKLKEK